MNTFKLQSLPSKTFHPLPDLSPQHLPNFNIPYDLLIVVGFYAVSLVGW